MRVSALSVAVLLWSLSACVVQPQQASQPADQQTIATAPQAAGAEATNAGEDDEVQCKTVYNTGSRLDQRKVCTTRAERERAAANAKEFLDHSSRGSQVLTAP